MQSFELAIVQIESNVIFFVYLLVLRPSYKLVLFQGQKANIILPLLAIRFLLKGKGNNIYLMDIPKAQRGTDC